MSRPSIRPLLRPSVTKNCDDLLCQFSSLSVSHQNRSYHSRVPSQSLPSHHRRVQQQQQIRHASSARRHRKLLNLPPSFTHGGPSHPTGSSGRSRTALQHSRKIEGDHLIFDPAPTPPNPYHTPLKFLPKEDVRRALHEQEISSSASPKLSLHANTKWPASAELPPAIHYTKRKENSSHLGPEEIEKMRVLQLADAKKWTQWRLAREFNCSNVFVRMVTRPGKQRREELKQEEIERRKHWSARRKRAFEDRQKRRAMIERDE